MYNNYMPVNSSSHGNILHGALGLVVQVAGIYAGHNNNKQELANKLDLIRAVIVLKPANVHVFN